MQYRAEPWNETTEWGLAIVKSLPAHATCYLLWFLYAVEIPIRRRRKTPMRHILSAAYGGRIFFLARTVVGGGYALLCEDGRQEDYLLLSGNICSNSDPHAALVIA
ncbi:membrane-bound metal-dependent hydrolase [Anopheles sinensis]|uniref:Membrane-bound metal-dependent hydrolase n=1 Tax=Anopheles sinensis TaxID=74873 RepID=A0A084W3G7_ANOSI|nr:membrane-bound metal-dependent hydrolase [Anopheles sinensis]